MLAGAMKVFGENLPVVRFFGDACIFFICVFTFACAARTAGVLPAVLGIVVLIAASSLPLGQHTQTEHFAMVMVMGALWLVLSSRRHLWSVGLAGMLMSMATLTRTNLAIVVVALELTMSSAPFRPREGVHIFLDACLHHWRAYTARSDSGSLCGRWRARDAVRLLAGRSTRSVCEGARREHRKSGRSRSGMDQQFACGASNFSPADADFPILRAHLPTTALRGD